METYAEVLIRKEREFQIQQQLAELPEVEIPEWHKEELEKRMQEYNMETYADLYAKREEYTMTNYNEDEDDRREDRRKRAERNSVSSVEIGKDETPYTAVDIELSDDDFMGLALQAHERDITFNKMINIILKDGIKQAEHRFEHGNKPQLLNEGK